MRIRTTQDNYRSSGIFLLVLFLVTGCAASSSMKAGEEAINQGDYFRAAQSYIKVLGGSFKKGDALAKLSEIAEPAYQQKLDLAEELESQGRYEGAISEYKKLNALLASLRQHELLNFSTINVGDAMARASESAAEQYYTQAEGHFANQSYGNAIDSYEKVLTFTGRYKDTKKKLAASHYRLGQQAERSGRLRGAINSYLKADEIVSGYQSSRNRAGKIHYHMANHFLEHGHCRQAYEDFNTAQNLGAGYADIARKIGEAKECGTLKIAFHEFENNTGRNFPGMNLGDFLFENIKSKTRAKSSEFIRLMSREQLDIVLREQRISAGRLNSRGSMPSTIEGVDYLIFGKVNTLEKKHEGQEKEVNRSTYKYQVERSYTDESGKKKTKKEWIEKPMSYTVVTDARDVILSGTIEAVDVKTSEVAIHYIIDQQANDNVRYAESYRAAHDLNGKNIKIDSAIRSLANGKKELKDEMSLAREIVDRISDEMTNRILNVLDIAGNAPDPSEIPLELPKLGD